MKSYKLLIGILSGAALLSIGPGCGPVADNASAPFDPIVPSDEVEFEARSMAFDDIKLFLWRQTPGPDGKLLLDPKDVATVSRNSDELEKMEDQTKEYQAQIDVLEASKTSSESEEAELEKIKEELKQVEMPVVEFEDKEFEDREIFGRRFLRKNIWREFGQKEANPSPEQRLEALKEALEWYPTEIERVPEAEEKAKLTTQMEKLAELQKLWQDLVAGAPYQDLVKRRSDTEEKIKSIEEQNVSIQNQIDQINADLINPLEKAARKKLDEIIATVDFFDPTPTELRAVYTGFHGGVDNFRIEIDQWQTAFKSEKVQLGPGGEPLPRFTKRDFVTGKGAQVGLVNEIRYSKMNGRLQFDVYTAPGEVYRFDMTRTPGSPESLNINYAGTLTMERSLGAGQSLTRKGVVRLVDRTTLRQTRTRALSK